MRSSFLQLHNPYYSLYSDLLDMSQLRAQSPCSISIAHFWEFSVGRPYSPIPLLPHPRPPCTRACRPCTRPHPCFTYRSTTTNPPPQSTRSDASCTTSCSSPSPGTPLSTSCRSSGCPRFWTACSSASRSAASASSSLTALISPS